MRLCSWLLACSALVAGCAIEVTKTPGLPDINNPAVLKVTTKNINQPGARITMSADQGAVFFLNNSRMGPTFEDDLQPGGIYPDVTSRLDLHPKDGAVTAVSVSAKVVSHGIFGPQTDTLSQPFVVNFIRATPPPPPHSGPNPHSTPGPDGMCPPNTVVGTTNIPGEVVCCDVNCGGLKPREGRCQGDHPPFPNNPSVGDCNKCFGDDQCIAPDRCRNVDSVTGAGVCIP